MSLDAGLAEQALGFFVGICAEHTQRHNGPGSSQIRRWLELQSVLLHRHAGWLGINEVGKGVRQAEVGCGSRAPGA